MKVLIIEDERLAADRLIKLILSFRADYEVVDRLDSVESAVEWFTRNQQPDLVFLDIHLADGNSFDVFKEIEVTCSIIFCTAYDQYALQAFKVNSIDYLLKPVEPKELQDAILKFEKNRSQGPAVINIEDLVSSFAKPYKSRFVTKVGEHLHAVETTSVLYFFSEERVTYLQNNEGKRLIIDYPLDKVESMVDPKKFFRINRKYLVSFPAVKDILAHSNSRLRLVLQYSKDDEIVVSRERVQDFKSWLDA